MLSDALRKFARNSHGDTIVIDGQMFTRTSCRQVVVVEVVTVWDEHGHEVLSTVRSLDEPQ